MIALEHAQSELVGACPRLPALEIPTKNGLL